MCCNCHMLSRQPVKVRLASPWGVHSRICRMHSFFHLMSERYTAWTLVDITSHLTSCTFSVRLCLTASWASNLNHSNASNVGQSRVQWSPIIPQLRQVACLNVFFFTSTFTFCSGWYRSSCSRIHPLKFGIRFATSNDLSHNEIDLFLIPLPPKKG